MSQDWCTIESDPGIFTELIKNIGVKDIQVEEILDLSQLSSNENIYGVIFLFKYISKTNYKPKVLIDYDKDLYFAKQVIVNACATQAILAILLNNDQNINIGETLKDLKAFTNEMDPSLKGLCFADCEKVKQEHNKFSKPSQFIESSQKRKANDDDDVFHFVSYIFFKGSIYEIDGLQDGPILVKSNVSKSNWIEELKPSIMDRISLYSENEIKFNLMYVTDCRINKILASLEEINKSIELQLSKNNDSDIDLSNLYSIKDSLEMNLHEEKRKREAAKEENIRRQHNYIPLIFEMLKYMSEKGNLEKCYNKAKEDENK